LRWWHINRSRVATLQPHKERLMSRCLLLETGKNLGRVDGRGHAMFGWRMEEEAKLEFTITVNWRRKDGSMATTQLGTLDRCRDVFY
jgi:hypothetical protein